ncbi:MAG: glycosyltransferase family 2 protein [Eubacteriales bacterium]|nr:glycosyltransferase family 2 protein [Eubacteriales bacterium]
MQLLIVLQAFGLVLTIGGLVAGLLMLWKIPGIKTRQQPVSLDPFTVSILIPAYNEGRRISPLLKSLRHQTYRPFEIIVINDHSTDQTAQLAADLGATVVLADPVLPGYVGKSRACWSGAKVAQGNTLIFLDADTWLDHPNSLRDLLTTYQSTGARGLLSVQPYHRVQKFYESFSTLFNIIVFAGMNRFTVLGDRLLGAGAFGPCMVCSRGEYLSIGGHQAVHGAVMDDLALGQLYAAANLPVACLSGRNCLSFRMYPEGFHQLFEGWTKSFGTASAATHPFVMTLIILWITSGFSSVLGLVVAIKGGDLMWIFGTLVTVFAMQVEVIWISGRVGRFHILLQMAYPFLFMFFAILFGWSTYLTKVRRQVKWRGRSIDV